MIARRWRLVVAALGVGWTLLTLVARGDFAVAVTLLVVAGVTWPCLVGHVTWPSFVTGRLTRLTRRCWDEWQRRDWDAMAPRMAADIVMEDVAEGRVYRGPAEVRARLERFVESFPDGRIAVLGIDESANRTTSQLAFWGTNTGPIDGRPPTGRRVASRFCEVFTFRGGQIVRVEEYYDRHALLRQLGLACEPPRSAPARQPGATIRPDERHAETRRHPARAGITAAAAGADPIRHSEATSRLGSTSQPSEAPNARSAGRDLDSPIRARWVRSAFELLMIPGLSFMAQGNLVAAMVGLEAAKTGWTVEQLERIVALRSLVASAIPDPGRAPMEADQGSPRSGPNTTGHHPQ